MKRSFLIIAGSIATCALLAFLLLPLIPFSPTLNSGLLGQAVKRADDGLVAQADSLSFRVNPWRNRVYIKSEQTEPAGGKLALHRRAAERRSAPDRDFQPKLDAERSDRAGLRFDA